MLPDTWIPHRREDGELIGWIDMAVADPRLVPIDRLGRALEPVDDWFEAEEALEAIGLRFLAQRFEYRGPRLAAQDQGQEQDQDQEPHQDQDQDDDDVESITVRIAHVYDDRIVLTTALTDAIEDVGEEIVVPFPAPVVLRELG
ncbi:hypothetical protein G6016_15145 [Dietzia aerolata]|uniref:Uncharacterized protein n=1 Tax=Dietzia aerolata TaxID=595984 RepID=A0ABV5JV15_9ACTN|nr:hypothetical protein [Dietzia aerolata]MBB0970268.1 hypothetical protein [Dietzia aerolata]